MALKRSTKSNQALLKLQGGFAQERFLLTGHSQGGVFSSKRLTLRLFCKGFTNQHHLMSIFTQADNIRYQQQLSSQGPKLLVGPCALVWPLFQG